MWVEFEVWPIRSAEVLRKCHAARTTRIRAEVSSEVACLNRGCTAVRKRAEGTRRCEKPRSKGEGRSTLRETRACVYGTVQRNLRSSTSFM